MLHPPSPTVTGTHYDTAAIRQLINLGASTYAKDTAQSDSLLKTALLQSQHSGFALGAFTALNHLAHNARSVGNYPKMLQFMFQAAPYARLSGNMSRLYNNIGAAYLNLGKYSQALHYFSHALDKENGFRTYRDSIYVNINTGFLWTNIEEHNQSLQYYSTAKQIAFQHDDSALLAMAMTYVGDGYYYINQFQRAEAEYLISLPIARKKSTANDVFTILYSVAMACIKQQKYEAARAYLTQADTLQTQNPIYVDRRLVNQKMWGTLYLTLGQPQQAEAILMPASDSAQAHNFRHVIREVEPKLAEALYRLGRYKEAYEHQQVYTLLNDSLLKQEKTYLLNELANTQIATKERKMMAEQFRNVQEKQVLQRKNFWLGGAIGILLVLIGAILLALRAYRSRQAYQQGIILQLRQSQEINQLKAQIRGEECERERVARELHDGIASQLWAITLSTNHIQQHADGAASWKEELSEIYQQLRETSQNVRRTAHNLMPDLLLQEGLSVALASVCKRAGHHSTLEIEFLEYGQVPRVDPEIELSIFRMAQELVQNTLKHAVDATYLLVQVSCTDALLNITVEDNGPGFDVGTQEGVGLHQIRKRITALKGHFDLESSPGKGTAAYLEFDLSNLI